MPNPWFAPTELVYARDLTFEGVSDTLRLGWGDGSATDKSHVYLTLGAFPILGVPLSNQGTTSGSSVASWALPTCTTSTTAPITCVWEWRITTSCTSPVF